jgi:anti-anti-sigma factor
MTKFDVTERGDGTASQRVIDVHGEFGLGDVGELQALLDKAAADGAGVVIGLAHCEFIDSMALASLIRAHNRFAAEGRRLVIGGSTTQVRRVLEISGLSIDGLAFDSVEEALAGG